MQKIYSMSVLMPNFAGYFYQFELAGKNAFRDNSGVLKELAVDFLAVKKENNQWISQIAYQDI